MLDRSEAALEESVQFLTNHPDLIKDSWFGPRANRYGNLFLFCSPSGCNLDERGYDGYAVGCPSMVKAYDRHSAFTEELTNKIRSLPLPLSVDDITPEHLPYFKQAQLWVQEEVDRFQLSGI